MFFSLLHELLGQKPRRKGKTRLQPSKLRRPIPLSLELLEDRTVLSAPLADKITGLPAGLISPEGTAILLGSSVSGPPGLGPTSYQWSVTENGQLYASSASSTCGFTPDDAGTYVVSLTVKDKKGKTATTSATITATDVAPTVSLSGPSSAIAGSAVAFTATTTDPSSVDMAAGFTYAWNFGDGTPVQTVTGGGAVNKVTHTYAAAGSYNVTVTVTDTDGLQGSAAVVVVVSPSLQATITGLPSWGYSPLGTQLTLGSSVSGGVGADTYSWTVTQNGATVTTGTGSSLSFTPPSTGTYQVALSVTDSANETATASGSVVVDLAPTVSLVDPSGQAGSAIPFTASAANPNVGEAAGFTYSWNFGDGKTDSGTSATDSHAYAAAGTYTATVTVTDSVGEQASASTTVVVAADLTATITGLPASGYVTFGTQLTLGSSVSGGVGADAYSWTVTQNGATVASGAGSSLAFTPSATGTYQVALTATDAVKDTASASGSVVIDLPPTVSLGGPYSGQAGSAIAFTASASNPNVGEAAGFTYSWNFGDGATASGSTATVSHAYAAAGSYTVTVTVTDSVGETASTTASVSVAGLTQSSGAFIQTSHDLIPNFGANPTITALRSGNWSDPTMWSLDRLPGAGDVVSIGAGETVTYDVVSTANVDTVAIQAGGTLQFRTDVNTTLTVVNLLVMPGGTLTVGTVAQPVAASVKAQIIFPDVPFNYTQDPSQYGHGLIGLGNVFMCGAAMNETWVQLAADAHAGDTTLKLAQPVSGWQVGARIVLPDTQELWGYVGATYTPEDETAVIAAVSPDGLTVTLASPLQFNHLGSVNLDGQEEFMPDVGILSHNVIVRSQNSNGVRGHVVFMDRANVDIRYVTFGGLGRTSMGAAWPLLPIDNTTYDANGNVTHIGTNEAGRYPVYFDHVAGPTAIPADGYQFTFVGNSIFCQVDPMPYMWGLDLNDSHFGLVQDNVLYNWAGAGLVTESGNETGNVISQNFVVDIRGPGTRSNQGTDGNGFWFHGTNNYVTGNVAAQIVGMGSPYAYGFNFSPVVGGPTSPAMGTVAEPAYQGAETWVAGQYNLVNANAQSLPAFSGNEVYGSYSGLTVWWLGLDPSFNPIGTAGTIKDFTVWNVSEYGMYLYYTNNLTIDGYVARSGEPTIPSSVWAPYGIFNGDYAQRGLVVTNSNIQGFANGIDPGSNMIGNTLIENSYLRNITNILIETPWSVSGGAAMQAHSTTITNVQFAAPPGGPAYGAMPLVAIDMWYNPSDGDNIVVPNLVYVYDYNGIRGDNFQVYFTQQAPTYVVPQTGVITPGDTHPLIGAPVAGLTNQQLWAQYGMAIAGAVAPDTLTMDGIINGFISPL
jgi:PKD repeat protein